MRGPIFLALALALLSPALVPGGVATPPAVYSWSFDDGPQGWSASPATGWRLHEQAAYGSGLGWATNTPGTKYGNGIDISLTSPSLDLTTIPSPVLVLWIRGQAEPTWDYLHIDASQGTGPWASLVAWDSPFPDWQQALLSLDAYSGQDEVRLRFRFTSDTAFGFAGYHIDSIVVAPMPEVRFTAPQRHVANGTAVSFTAAAGSGVTDMTLDLGDGTTMALGTTTTTVQHRYAAAGNHWARLHVETPYFDFDLPLGVSVHDNDPFGTRVVVAVVDTGVNPYHETYQRPGIHLPLDEFIDARDGQPARTIALNRTGAYATNVLSDDPNWDSIQPEELVHFAGTNLLGIDFDPSPGAPGVLDLYGHGTPVTDTLLQQFPEAIIVLVQAGATGLDGSLPRAMAWAIEQPWIDMISVSMGMVANLPEPVFFRDVPKMQRQAWESGKMWFASAGNYPAVTPTDHLDSSPWAISVTGSNREGYDKVASTTSGYPDVASDYFVEAASPFAETGRIPIAGTSFSCPTVAGTMAAALYKLRIAADWTGGIENGKLVPPTGTTNHDMRSAMNKTAIHPPLRFEGRIGSTFTPPPYARAALFGWGQVDARIIDDIVTVVQSGDHSLPAFFIAEKRVTAEYMRASYALRHTYWEPQTRL